MRINEEEKEVDEEEEVERGDEDKNDSNMMTMRRYKMRRNRLSILRRTKPVTTYLAKAKETTKKHKMQPVANDNIKCVSRDPLHLRQISADKSFLYHTKKYVCKSPH